MTNTAHNEKKLKRQKVTNAAKSHTSNPFRIIPDCWRGSTQRKNIEKLNAANAFAGIRCELFPIIAWRRARQKNIKNEKDISKGKLSNLYNNYGRSTGQRAQNSSATPLRQ